MNNVINLVEHKKRALQNQLFDLRQDLQYWSGIDEYWAKQMLTHARQELRRVRRELDQLEQRDTEPA